MADTLSELGFIPRLTLFPLLRVLGETTQGEMDVTDTHDGTGRVVPAYKDFIDAVPSL